MDVHYGSHGFRCLLVYIYGINRLSNCVRSFGFYLTEEVKHHTTKEDTIVTIGVSIILIEVSQFIFSG